MKLNLIETPNKELHSQARRKARRIVAHAKHHRNPLTVRPALLLSILQIPL